MPVYEYKCRACGHKFEQLVLPNSAPATCPRCQSHDLERLLSLFAVSSDSSRERNLQRARKKQTTDPGRRDKHVAEQQYVRDHFADEGIRVPPLDKNKK